MEVNRGSLQCIRVCRRAPEVSHLLFTDDSILFARADERDAQAIRRVLECYSQASGQQINLSKSEVVMSSNLQQSRKEELAALLEVKLVEAHDKYLGMPTGVGRPKTRALEFLKERVWKILKGWKQQLLSFAGREILLKAVVQAIPTYIMSLFRLPLGLCHDIQRMMARFWWGGKEEERKIAWVAWAS
ncbi:uncharacterized protein [Spinacia oleracea]|uniref:Reverse transcriptase domain-containing protein n=1 Tax=Spinacia oleracea TaxID=3562 RepID=A0ABM3R7S7_SPIOL|nr:uncharacterized protein LOC130467241 [Spinacia oleracea]